MEFPLFKDTLLEGAVEADYLIIFKGEVHKLGGEMGRWECRVEVINRTMILLPFSVPPPCILGSWPIVEKKSGSEQVKWQS